jgi:hypothetical protein
MTMEQLLEAERAAAECLSMFTNPLPPVPQDKAKLHARNLPSKSA